MRCHRMCPDFEHSSRVESMKPSKILAVKDVNELRFSKLSLKYTLEPGALVFLSCTQNLQVWKGLRWQERIPLHLTDPGPIHIPSIQERAERLVSRFKGKPERPPKVITMHGCFCGFLYFWYIYGMCTLAHPLKSDFPLSTLPPFLPGAQEKAVTFLFRAVESFPRPEWESSFTSLLSRLFQKGSVLLPWTNTSLCRPGKYENKTVLDSFKKKNKQINNFELLLKLIAGYVLYYLQHCMN